VTVRVLLADDQPLVRGGFAFFVNAAPDLTVVAEAGTGREAVELARRSRADVVVMDIRMPEMDGLAATRLITADEDLAGVRVLILTTFEVDEYVFAALRAGASGFLGKNAEPDDLLDAIRTVHRGDSLLSPSATRALIGRFLAQPGRYAATAERLARLTDREREVLGLVAAGLSNDDIANHLVVSPHTVKTHVNRTMTKLDAHDRAQLVIAAYEAGLVRPAAGESAGRAHPGLDRAPYRGEQPADRPREAER
jgi:DNA-binding NarL/FixJ family response regulator